MSTEKPISAMITTHRVSITLDGRYRAFDRASEQGAALIEALKEKPQDHAKIRKIADIASWLAQETFGRVVLDDKDQIRLDGEVVNYVAAPVFIRILKDGFDMTPITAFIEKIAENPDQSLVDHLYGFCDTNGISIDPEGYLHLYKRVDPNFLSYASGREPVTIFYPDGYDGPIVEGEFTEVEGGKTTVVTGRIPHPVGGWLDMPRTFCNPSRQAACSVGLHACGFDYLRTYHGGAGVILHVRIHPAWITAFPYDDEAKLRCHRMEILNVIPEADAQAYFSKAVERRHVPVEEAPPAPRDWAAEGQKAGRVDGANDRMNGYDYDASVSALPDELEGRPDDIHVYTTTYVAGYKEGWDATEADDESDPIPANLEAWSVFEARTLGEADGYAYAAGDTVFDCDPEMGDEWTSLANEAEDVVSAYKQGFTTGYTKRFGEENG